MKTAQAEIRTLVDFFVDQLTQHIRVAAVESVQNALGGNGMAPARAKAAPAKRAGAKPGPKPKAAKAKKTGKGGRRVRRNPEQIAAAKDAIARYVSANPGTAMGDLSSALGEDPITIRVQLNELLEEGALRKEGERRGTRYFAGSGAAPRRRRPSGGRRRQGAARARSGRPRRRRRRRKGSSSVHTEGPLSAI